MGDTINDLNPFSSKYAGTAESQIDDTDYNIIMKRLNEVALGNDSGFADAKAQQIQNQATGNVLGTIASQKALSPSERANLAGTQMAQMQSQGAADANLLREAKKMEANQALADLWLQRTGLGLKQFEGTQGRRAGIMQGLISGTATAVAGKGK